MVGWWRFDGSLGPVQTASTIEDASGSNRAGTVRGDSLRRIAGPLGEAILFNAPGEHIELPVVQAGAGRSVALWVRFENPFVEQAAFLRVPSADTDTGTGLQMDRERANVVRGTSDPTSSWPSWVVRTQRAIEPKTWYQIAFVMDDDTLRLYVNGELDNERHLEKRMGIMQGEMIFGNARGDRRFDGALDDVSLWNRVLTTEEIAEMHRRQSPTFEASYRSPVCDGGSPRLWTQLRVDTDRPAWKQMPTTRETDYALGNLDPMGLVAAWSMNGEAGPLLHGSAIADASANALHGQANNVDGDGMTYAEGLFGTAVSFDGMDDQVVIPWEQSVGVADEHTIAAWVKLAPQPADQDGVILSLGDGHKLLVTAAGKAALSYGGPNSPTALNAFSPLDDERWHHVIAVHRTGEFTRLYVDGEVEASSASPSELETAAQDLKIGGIGQAHFRGLLDEISLWKRALTNEEAVDLYRRGANRLKVQVRSCDDAACDGEEFVGPDGTPDSYFSELLNPTGSRPAYPLRPRKNRFFQYRMILEPIVRRIGLR